MGDDSEGPIKYLSNGAVTVRNVQGGVSVSVTLWKRDLGGYRGDTQVPDAIPT